MPSGGYNLGTASGRIVVDGSGAVAGFNVAKTAGQAFFNVVKYRIGDVQKLGRRLAAVGAGGVVGFGKAVQTASAFEKQMSGVYAVANANKKEMTELRDEALRLGKDTQYSASEAAAALEELVKAGVSTKDVIGGAADATVALAAAGGIDIPQAATIAANAMNSFQITAKKLPEIADILAGVANTSAADVDGLGQSLSQVSAVAHLSGLDLRDTAIAIGELANAGIKGSDAGTSLKTFLLNLIPTTEKQTNKFEELGLLSVRTGKAMQLLAKNGVHPTDRSFQGLLKSAESVVVATGNYKAGTYKAKTAALAFLQSAGALNNQFFDQAGNVKNLRGLQEALATATKGQTKEQKLANLNILFGNDAMRASAILSQQGAKGYDKFSTSVAKTNAADVAKTRMKNLSGAVEQFKGSLETVQITVGAIMIPILTKLVKAATAVLNAFLSLPKGIQKAVGIMLAIFSIFSLGIGLLLAFLPVIAVFIVHMLAMRAIKTVTKSFLVFFRALRGGEGVMAAGARGFTIIGKAAATAGKRVILFTRIMKLARAAFLILTGPVGIVIAVIAALIAIGVLLYKKWTPFRNIVNQIAGVFRGAFNSALTAAQPIIAKVVAAAESLWKTFKSNVLPALKAVGQMLMGNLKIALQQITDAWNNDLKPAVSDLVKSFRSDMLPALKQAWEAAKPLVQIMLKVAGVLLGALAISVYAVAKIFLTVLLPALIYIGGFFAGAFIGFIAGAVTAIIGLISGLIRIFTGLLQFVTGVLTGNWGQAWRGIQNIVKGVATVIISVVQGMIRAFAGLFRALSHVPGFGWAKKAADAMEGAANKAQELKDKINGVPEKKEVSVKVAAQQALGILQQVHNLFAGINNKTVSITTIHVNKTQADNQHANGGGKLPGAPRKSNRSTNSPFGRGSDLDQRRFLGLTPAYAGDPLGVAQRSVSAPARQRRSKTVAPTGGASRMIRGTLSIDKSGRAYIEGVAVDVIEDRDRGGRTNNRRRGGVGL